ncbi:hypothetical protein [Loktanella salsilacus]|uniref:hypothetical protein n=1 Tax=Loktanella salsilacus TaxID=195913 RepID=UPI003704D1A2
MPRTFTFTPTDQDQIFAITVIRDELTVVNVSDGNTKLQLSISTTGGGSPIIQIPSTGGKFDLRPSLLESLDEGMTYQHNIWDYSNSVDGKRIATGTFTHAESIKSVDIAYPTVTLADGTLRIFVTQAQYDAIDPRLPNAEYVISDATTAPGEGNAPTAANALADQSYTQNTGDKTINAALDFQNASGGTWSVSGAGATINQSGLITIPTSVAASGSVIVTYTNPTGTASTSFSVTVAAVAVTTAPTASNALADQSYTQSTGDKTVNAASDFTNATGGAWSVSGAGATISAAGVVTIPTSSLRSAVTVTVTYTNSGGSASSAFSVTVTAAVVARQVVAAVGQSENAVALFITTSGPYNQQPPPPLLSGVDGIMVKSGHNSASGQPEIIPITQARIDAGDIGPGAVAYFNFMHHISGGAPQALVDLSDPGTGMESMMDDDSVTRDYTIDRATVDLAEANGLFVDLGVYCWSNSEAAASPDLIAFRNPHLIGRNPDGTPYQFGGAGAGVIEHCLIDTTGRGFGLLPDTAKLSLMLFHPRIADPINVTNPPAFGYRTNADGSQIAGMTKSNGFPAVQARKNFLAQSYLDGNRGVVGVSQAISLYGDYAGGVKAASGQSSIHPSALEPDGQILTAQHIAAHAAYAYGYMQIPSGVTLTASNDGTSVLGEVSLPAGTQLKTIRQIKGETVESPRPHQQEVMGLAIWRDDGSFSELEVRPIWRNGQGPSVGYEGSVTITDAAAGTFTTTLVTPLENGDYVDFGTDGAYGTFSLYGQPDYDARMYQDTLVAHDAALYAATGYYGVPVEPQTRYVATGINVVADTTAPTLSAATAAKVGQDAYTASVQTNEAGGRLYYVITQAATATAATIKAGPSKSVTAAGTQNASGSGLTAGTVYYAHFIHVDAAGNESTALRSPSFTTDAISTPFASRAATADAYLLGPVLPAGVEAMTVTFDVEVPFNASGNVEFFEVQGTHFSLKLDAREGQRTLSGVLEDGDGLAIYGQGDTGTSGAGTLTTARQSVVVSVSLNNAGSSAFRIFVDGVLLKDATPVVVAGRNTFPTIRALEFFRSVYALKVYGVQVYAGTHAQGFSADSSVTGLTLLHTLSGAASSYNNPPAPLTKQGVDLFT